jgi:hypothetical protein
MTVMTKPVDLAKVASQLYSLAPDRFTAARNEQATEAAREGDKELAARIRKLAKPPVAAWVVNLLVRRSAEEMEQVLGLGALLREATADLDRSELQGLSRQRQKLVSALARRGAELSEGLGQPVSAVASREVEQTLHAAMADQNAADAVRTGCLVRSLSSTGFEPVELSGAVAVDGVVPDRTASAKSVAAAEPARKRADQSSSRERDRALRQAQKQAEDAEESASRTLAEAEDLRGRLSDLDEQREDLTQELRLAREQVSRVDAELRRATSETRFVRQALERAGRDADAARRAADRARGRVRAMGHN